MIQIDSLHIEEFRGIRSLDLVLNGKSFVVHGPNGSGKSGVVDAIGFALTGAIARLSGTGTAGISMQKHGPHVHRRDDPGAAWVQLTFKDTVSGQVGTVRRSIKDAAGPVLDPDTPELRQALAAVQAHPETTLSRRELIQFILAEAGKRAAEVQALLQLNELEQQRKSLKTALGKLSKEKSASAAALDTARNAVCRHLDTPSLDSSEVLRVVNAQRNILGLPELVSVDQDTDLSEGVDQQPEDVPFDKPSSLRDINALVDALASDEHLTAQGELVLTSAATLADHPDHDNAIKHRAFVESGLALLDQEARCPLCDKEWCSVDELRRHLDRKIAQSQEAADLFAAASKCSQDLVAQIELRRSPVAAVRSLATIWGTPEMRESLRAWDEGQIALGTKLSTVAGTVQVLDELRASPFAVPRDVTDNLEALSRIVSEKPDTSARVRARNFLLIAKERWSNLRIASVADERAVAAYELGQVIYKTFCDTMDSELGNLYDEVEGRFSHFYRLINAEDESGFKAQLEPTAGKLDLLVDFYGLGMFPPAAYHSEGHQDGMGVCLYLALVERLLGTGFRFAVLDDVVMSVDSNHRKQFCELLKTEFPDVQFIITTHDEVWAKQMQTAGLVSKQSQVRFQGWTVDSGPASDHGKDFWDRIDADLAVDDVHSAAHKLRRGLEAELPDIAEGLRAWVRYRGDAKYELGELLDAVKGQHGKLLKQASKSADSWKLDEAKSRVEVLKRARAAALLAQEGENWAINALVHNNDWAVMSKSDFEPVVRACRQFLDLFRCDNPDCGSWISVVGPTGKEENLRCRCGTYNLNLIVR